MAENIYAGALAGFAALVALSAAYITIKLYRGQG